MISYSDIKSGRAAVPAETGDHGLALELIKIDGGTQSRATLNDQVVSEYAEAIKAGATFPPIVVFYDGKKHWLADGFHRFHAYQKAGRSKVAADIRQGTRRDAILHSVGANETHGLRRTRDDKRRAVLTLLNDAEWAAKPERWIATTANVSHTYVQKIRAEHLATLPDRPAEVEVERGGTVYTQKVAKAAKSNAREALVNDEPSPEAGPQAEAFQSQGTGAGMLADREGRHEGEAASVGLPTVSDEDQQFSDLMKAWNAAGRGARARFLAAIGLAFADASVPKPSGPGANITMRHENIQTSPSAVASAEPEASPSPPGASGSLSDPQPISSPVIADSPASISSPEPGTLSEKRDCLKLKDGHCKLSFSTSALCAECNAERMKRRAAA